jgi:Fur family ferric uptake transcriptional regulator
LTKKKESDIIAKLKNENNSQFQKEDAMKKLYKTPARQAVLSLFCAHPHRHFTAEQVCTLLCKVNEAGTALMGKSTVYRQLSQLCERGQLRRFEDIDSSGGAVHVYQYVAPEQNCAAHFHLKCQRCGRISHLDCTLTDELAAHLHTHHGFAVCLEDSILYGLCADCHVKKEEERDHAVF